MEDSVILNVYSLSSWNFLIRPLGIGVFHCGVEVYGLEYTYYSGLGIVTCCPKKAPNCKLRESLEIGRTKHSEVEVSEMIDELLHEEFSSGEYHLTRNNCHHFCKFYGKWLIEDITREFYPSYIDRSTRFFRSVDFVIPKKWIHGIGNSASTLTEEKKDSVVKKGEYLSEIEITVDEENSPLLQGKSSRFSYPEKVIKNPKRITKKRVVSLQHRNAELGRRVKEKVKILTTQEQQITRLEGKKKELEKMIEKSESEVNKMKEALPKDSVERILRNRMMKERRKRRKKVPAYFDASSSGESESESESEDESSII